MGLLAKDFGGGSVENVLRSIVVMVIYYSEYKKN